MKILVFLVIVIFLFVFIFIKSNTLENQVEREHRRGIEYMVTKQSIHWNRFFNYIKYIPTKIINNLLHKNLF